MHKNENVIRAVAAWAMQNKIRYHTLSSRGTLESLNDDYLFEMWEETWLNPDAFNLPQQLFSRYKCCVFVAPLVTSFYFSAADELKFTSILQLRNFIAFIEKTVDDFSRACQCDFTAPSGRNMPFHPKYLEQCMVPQQGFQGFWVIIADFPGKLVLSSSLPTETSF